MDRRLRHERIRAATRACGAGMLSLLAATAVLAKDPFSTCQDICDTLTASACTVSTIHEVVPGSDIDCTTARDMTINTGELRVHDGYFILRGKSLTLTSGGKITADCPQLFAPIGFQVVVADDVLMVAGSQAKLSARCGVQGGRVVLQAADAITIDALGIDADGSAADALGGSVQLDGGGTVAIRGDVSAEATQGAARGGTIHVRGATIDVQAELRAKGFGSATQELPGGDIDLEATGNVTITAGGGLNATTAQGPGGHITIHAGALADVRRPLKAWGTSASLGAGGTVEVFGDQVQVNTDLTATGGRRGGHIEIESLDGGVSIGTTASTTLDVTGGSGEAGGSIRIAADGGAVTLGGNATLHATAGSGAVGGRIDLDAVDVTTNAATRIYANGASPDRGGEIEITARGLMTLAGTIDANPLGSKTFIYTITPPSISPTITGYEVVQMSYL